MNWTHRKNGSTVLEVIEHHSGMSAEELMHPKYVSPYDIENLGETLDVILTAIDSHKPIAVVGDYDADGITATAIMVELLRFLGASPRYRLPRRMSEGYGLSDTVIDEIRHGLIITVDNGISAFSAIEKAKKKGMQVLVLDHHLPQDALPDADVIVDPHLHPDRNGYEHYCGAGLALKLTEMAMDAYNTEPASMLLRRATSLAAIGTIADVMPLSGDNRRIVKDGLAIMQRDKKSLSAGLKTLLDTACPYSITETDISFKVGPLLNAPGRMLDDGATLALELLLSNSRYDAQKRAEKIAELNELRKTQVSEAIDRIEAIIRDQCLYGCVPLCVVDEETSEGIVGIVTGRLAEKYKVPAFVFTKSKETGILKGSGRTFGDTNLMDVVLSAEECLVRFGGHAAAAGLSVRESDYDEMCATMYEAMKGYDANELSDDLEYDLEVTASDIPGINFELQKYAPYGEGNPAPVFRINDIVLSPRFGSRYRLMGADESHLKLFGNGFSAIGFGMAKQYLDSSCPAKLSIIGTVSENVFQYASEVQVEMSDFLACPTEIKPSPLVNALRANGTI